MGQVCSQPEGRWVLNLGTRTLLVFELVPTTTSGSSSQGTLIKPVHFRTSDGWSFSDIHGGIEMEHQVASQCKDGFLSIRFQNPTDASDTDTFTVKQSDEKHTMLQLDLPGLSIPFYLDRRMDAPQVAQDWVPSKTYTPDDDLPSNAEMKRLFDEDQRVRQSGFKTDWTIVNKSDAERRIATMKLLDAGALHTAEDFIWAAFLFQHGDSPKDYLLAHTLALIAVRKGRDDAVWIATATLDRYLQSIQQPQVYGTQFRTLDKDPTTQNPYDRGLVSDSLRRELGVPIQSMQDEQRKQYDLERGVSK